MHGRAPSNEETDVALVNQAFAQRFSGRDDVVGESLSIRLLGEGSTQIIGVLEDLSFEHPSADVEPTLFVASARSFSSNSLALIESTLPAGELQQQLQGLIDSGALEAARVNSVTPLRTLRNGLIASDRARGFLTIGTAMLVVVLAAFGFYGTQRYLVTAGRREYAIRASLGAGPRALGRLVLARGLLLALPGLVLGLPFSFILVAWLRDDYVSRDISPGIVTLLVGFGLIGLMMAASIGPARQARRTQPAPLLRED